MEKIDINKIRGHWQESITDTSVEGYVSFSQNGGDDTVDSIKLVAEKINEIIEKLNSWENNKKEGEMTPV